MDVRKTGIPDISFHVNTDNYRSDWNGYLYKCGVHLPESPIYQCTEFGFGILDEINVAKMMRFLCTMPHWIIGEESIFQDITGFYFIRQRFIAMNYGYAGTRELNEALVSRFIVN